jgi:hypothetical protein
LNGAYIGLSKLQKFWPTTEKFDGDKSVTFNNNNNNNARLFERDDGPSKGVIAFSLDSNTVALIEVSINTIRHPGQDDEALYNGSAWDIINTITVT